MLLRRRPAAVPRSLLPQLTDHIEGQVTRKSPRWSRATITGVGSVPGNVLVQRTGEDVSDGGDVPVYIGYANATYGQPGGPQAGDDVLLLETSPGNPGALARTALTGAGVIAPAAAALGTLATGAASQYIRGTGSRGYVRVTASGSPPAAGSVLRVLFGATLASQPYVTLTRISLSTAAYGDATVPASADIGGGVVNVSPYGFDVAVVTAPTASLAYAWLYSVVL